MLPPTEDIGFKIPLLSTLPTPFIPPPKKPLPNLPANLPILPIAPE